MANEIAQIFCCKKGSFPIKYLGVPLHYDKLKKEDLQPIIDRIIKGVSGWLGRYLTYKGKIILLCACVISIPAYLMYVIKFPKWAINVINSQMAHFFWGNLGDQHKYHLANWGLITRRKEYGGMGVPNIKEYNMALLASWGERFFDDSDSDWKKIISHKYRVNSPNLLGQKVMGALPSGRASPGRWLLPKTFTDGDWAMEN